MTVNAGIYQHYKGPLYQVLGLAHDANVTVCSRDTDGDGDCYICNPYGILNLNAACRVPRIVVLYFGLQLDAAHEGPRLAVRTRSDFESYVHLPDGTVCAAMSDTGKPESTCTAYQCVQRFKFRGPDFRAWMLEKS